MAFGELVSPQENYCVKHVSTELQHPYKQTLFDNAAM